MIITPQHQELRVNYERLLMQQLQHEQIVKEKDDKTAALQSQLTVFKNAVDQMKEAMDEMQSKLSSLSAINQQQAKQLEKLSLIEHQYEQLKRLVYGRSSEKSPATTAASQLLLGIEAEKVEACSIHDGQRVAAHIKHKPKNENHPGRNELPAHLERKYVDIYPEGLPEDAELYDTIESEQLEHDPARLFVTVYRRYKYKLPKEDGTCEFFIADLPEDKDKSIAAPSLKAHVTVEKYLYHMPINRQVQRLAHSGVIVAATTIGNWIGKTAFDLTAIYDALRGKITHPALGYM